MTHRDIEITIQKGCACQGVTIGGYENQVELPTPKFMKDIGSIGCLTFRDTTCIDRCVAPLVQALWERGVVTTGACCGHNIRDGYIGIYESGASGPQCLLCLDKRTVPSNLVDGYVMDCPDCCGEEG